MKKISKPLIIISSIICIITLFLLYVIYDLDQNNISSTYEYEVKITPINPNEEYFLILPMPNGWNNFTNDIKKVRGNATYKEGNIDGNLAINISGSGNVTISFFKDSNKEGPIDFSWAPKLNGTTKIFAYFSNNTIDINVNFKKLWHNPNQSALRGIEEYDIKGKIEKAGWNYIKMDGSMS